MDVLCGVTLYCRIIAPILPNVLSEDMIIITSCLELNTNSSSIQYLSPLQME